MVGPQAELWMASPDLALTLLACIPSGNLRVVQAREGIRALTLGPGWLQPASSTSPPILSSTSTTMPIPTDSIFIGAPDESFGLRATRWANPFNLLSASPLPCSHSSGGGGGPPAPMAWSCHLPAVPSAASLASPDGAVSVPSVLHPAAAVSPEKASQSASVSPEKTSLSLMQYTQWLNDRADLSTSEGFAFPLRSAAVCPIPLSP